MRVRLRETLATLAASVDHRSYERRECSAKVVSLGVQGRRAGDVTADPSSISRPPKRLPGLSHQNTSFTRYPGPPAVCRVDW
jgi:hypothetical protein